MGKILFLATQDFYGKRISEYQIDVISPFRDIWSVFKVLRILHFNLKLPYKNIWFNEFEQIENYGLIILPANEFSIYLAPYIERLVRCRGPRLVFWYWNPVKPKYSPELISSRWEKWTFDKEDSVKYDMKYAGTYYFPLPGDRVTAQSTDIFFVGLDKGRYQELCELRDKFTECGLTVDFHIVNDNKQVFKNRRYKTLIAYDAVIDRVANSKAILEVMQENQTGLTLRTMESLFLSRKLITNNKTIVGYNFYREENIFILGVNDLAGLKSFVETPYMPLDPKLVKQYEFMNWKERILNNVELDDGFKKNICK